jgi:hypothetical protein
MNQENAVKRMTARLARRVFSQAQPKRIKTIIQEWKTKKKVFRKFSISTPANELLY